MKEFIQPFGDKVLIKILIPEQEIAGGLLVAPVSKEKSNKGNKYAALTLAKLYDYDDEIENDRDKAIYWYKIAANLGLAEAQNHYGFVLAQQEVYDMAFKWYEKAAKQNYEEAIANLGYCYLYGRGVQKYKEKARELLESCHMDYLYIPDELYEDDEDEEWN